MPWAQAAYCTANSHCYGRAVWPINGVGVNGAQTILQSNCLTLTDYVNTFITNELWVSPADFQTYVEAGVAVGNGNSVVTTPALFWADKRPNHPYFQHNGPAYTLQSHVTAKIQSTATPGTWNIFLSGWNVPLVSTDNFLAPAFLLNTGTETVSDTGHSFGLSESLQYLNVAGAWVNGWKASSGASYIDFSGGGGLVAYWKPGFDYLWVLDGQGAQC